MKKLHPPIGWVGGKSLLRDDIINLIPTHNTYVEVFAGAAWVFFGKEPSKVEVINDINGDLVNLFRTIKNKPEEFHDALWYMFPSRQLHKMSKELLESSEGILTDTERAVLFYYQIKNAFGAKYGAGYAVTKARPPRSAIGMDTLIELQARLSQTHIENLPFDRLIRNYDQPSSFFYLDPPYVVADGKDHYQFTFDEQKHTLLRDLLAASKGKWLLSYDDVPLIRGLYKDHTIRKTKAIRYSLNSKGERGATRHELLISNY